MERWKPAGAGLTFGVFVSALVLSVTAAVRAVGDALEATDRDPLELAGTLERSRAVTLGPLGPLGERSTALAVHRWSKMGLDVIVGESPAESAGVSPRGAAGLIVLDFDDPRGLALLQDAGIEVEPQSWTHRAGSRSRIADAAAAVTVAEGGRPVTYVIAGQGGLGLEDEAVETLTRSLPRTRPWLTFWSQGARRLDVPLTMEGSPLVSRAVIDTTVIDATGASTDRAEVLGPDHPVVRRAEALRDALSARQLDPPRIVRVASYAGVGLRGLDGPVERAGWYDARRGELQVLRGVTGAVDDALAEYAEAGLLAAFGAPREPWLLDGLVAGLVGGSGGRPLAAVEAFATDVPFDQVVGDLPRTAAVLAPARAKLSTLFVDRCGGDWRRAFETGLDESLREELARAWRASAADDDGSRGAAADPTPVRSLAPGTAVRVSGAPKDARRRLGTRSFLADLVRIREVGFDSIVLEIQVPVAPPGPAERAALPVGSAGWGGNVTLEGDGAVLAAVAHARAVGLGVALSPRIVASPSGPLTGSQVHGGPDAYAAYGRRLVLAMEGVAWLAERAGANALVVFGPEDMPLARELASDDASEARRAGYPRMLEVRTSMRRAMVDTSRPYRGALLARAGSLLGAELAAAEARLEPGSVFRPGGVGVLPTLRVSGLATSRSLRAAFDRFRLASEGLDALGMWVRLENADSLGALGECLSEGDWPRTVIVDHWNVGAATGAPADLRSLSDVLLRGATGR